MEIDVLSSTDEYIWISALETSGDLHGGRLMEALKERGCSHSFVGIGGINMSTQGLHSIFSSNEFSVMGLVEVISHIPKIINAYKMIKSIFCKFNIKAVILIDAPDFHFRVAKMAWKLGIPVFYYISPQVWAWRKGRIKFLKKYITKLCCIFPFEKDFFAKHGLDVEYVGHPLMEVLNFNKLDSTIKDKDSLLLLPGSRVKEITSILPIMAKSCELIVDKRPEIKIKIVKAPSISRDVIQKNWNIDLDYKIVEFQDRYIEMAKSEMAIVASGTASLECGLLRLPAIVVYKVSRLTYIIGRIFVRTNYISMTNIILNKKIYPEFIQMDFTPENVSKTILMWKSDFEILNYMRKELLELRTRIGKTQASQETARIIMNFLQRNV